MTQNISLGSLKIDITESPGRVTYKVVGKVDDSFKHGDVPRIKAEHIILDLEGITDFNSCGVREWVFLIKDLGSLGKITFTNCSIAMVDQFNMVPESIGTGTVESFFAPYVCEDHGDAEILLDATKHKNNIENHDAPERPCAKCQKPLIFDAMADSYFLFLAPINTKLGKAS
ncbi:MAG: hypothetical protein WCO71_06165 [Pseudomonadota bacterium]